MFHKCTKMIFIEWDFFRNGGSINWLKSFYYFNLNYTIIIEEN